MIEKFTTMPFDAFYVSMLSEKYLKSSVPFVKGMFTGTKALFASANDPQKSSSLIYVLKKK